MSYRLTDGILCQSSCAVWSYRGQDEYTAASECAVWQPVATVTSDTETGSLLLWLLALGDVPLLGCVASVAALPKSTIK